MAISKLIIGKYYCRCLFVTRFQAVQEYQRQQERQHREYLDKNQQESDVYNYALLVNVQLCGFISIQKIRHVDELQNAQIVSKKFNLIAVFFNEFSN